jgi:hypothetical protein
MKIRHILAAALLAVAFDASANVQESAQASRADTQVDKIATNVAKYVAEIDRAIEMAKEGGYGKLQRGSEARLVTARETIGALLRDVADPRELPADKRIELFNAHETIASILKHQDKSRVVCTSDRKTGSRLKTTECLTVGEREERAKVSAELARETQRVLCVPGETSVCSN